jgi:pyruvate/2-oxoglutarate dehydrogenase complex dihydrolipoamide dehydrogenase (E3) component
MAEELTPDICVVGGGPGGIAVAVGAAAERVSVVLVEKDRLGGANLAYGGIPSKALLTAAGIHEFLRRAPAMGATGAPLQVDIAKVREHIDAVTAAVAPNVSAERLAALGVTVVRGAARFATRRTIAVGDTTIRARRFVLAVGSTPSVPELPGLVVVDYVTEAGAFDLGGKPTHLLVQGAGPRGLELAQAYVRLGLEVTVIDNHSALAGEDPELVAMVTDRMRADGVRLHVGVEIVAFARRRGGVRVTIKDAAEAEETVIDGSHLVVAGGRRPNVEGLGLGEAGVVVAADGIVVDRQLRTSNHRIYAIGDAVPGQALVNRAEQQADRVLGAILFRLPVRDDPAVVPAVTFTDPALATVGLSEAEATARHGKVRILRMPFVENDLAQAERLPAGMIKVIATARGRILGVSVVGHDAGELIALWSLAMANGLSIDAMRRFPAPYPTRAEISRRVAATFYGPGLTPPWRRRIIEAFRNLG